MGPEPPAGVSDTISRRTCSVFSSRRSRMRPPGRSRSDRRVLSRGACPTTRGVHGRFLGRCAQARTRRPSTRGFCSRVGTCGRAIRVRSCGGGYEADLVTWREPPVPSSAPASLRASRVRVRSAGSRVSRMHEPARCNCRRRRSCPIGFGRRPLWGPSGENATGSVLASPVEPPERRFRSAIGREGVSRSAFQAQGRLR